MLYHWAVCPQPSKIFYGAMVSMLRRRWDNCAGSREKCVEAEEKQSGKPQTHEQRHSFSESRGSFLFSNWASLRLQGKIFKDSSDKHKRGAQIETTSPLSILDQIKPFCSVAKGRHRNRLAPWTTAGVPRPSSQNNGPSDGWRRFLWWGHTRFSQHLWKNSILNLWGRGLNSKQLIRLCKFGVVCFWMVSMYCTVFLKAHSLN